MEYDNDDLNPYKPPGDIEQKNPITPYVLNLAEKTPTVKSKIGFGYTKDIISVFSARLSWLIGASFIYMLSSFLLPPLIGVPVVLVMVILPLEYHIGSELCLLALIVLLVLLYFTWLIPGNIRYMLRLIRGEPGNNLYVLFWGENSRCHARVLGLLMIWLLVSSLALAPFLLIASAVTSSSRILIDSDYTFIILLGLIELAVLSLIAVFFVIALFFAIDDDSGCTESLKKSFTYTQDNLTFITLHTFLFSVLSVLFFYTICCSFLGFGAMFSLFVFDFGMIYIGITGQKHCKSPVPKESDEW